MKKYIFTLILVVAVVLQAGSVFAARNGCTAELKGAYYDMNLGKAKGDVPQLLLNVKGQSTSDLAFHMVLDGAEWDIGKMSSIDKNIQITETSKNDIQVKFTYDYFKTMFKENNIDIALPLYAKNFSDGLVYINITETPTYMDDATFLFASNLAGYFTIDYDENAAIYKSGISELSDIVIRDKTSFALSPDKTEFKITLADNGFDFAGSPVVVGEGKYEDKLTVEAIGSKTFTIKLDGETNAEMGNIKISGLKMIKNNKAKGVVPKFYVSANAETKYTTNEGEQAKRSYEAHKYFDAGVALNEDSALTAETNSSENTADDENVLKFTVGSASYTLNGETVKTGAPCIIVNDRTLLPLRALANAIGITDENISYDSAAKTAVLKKGEKEISIQQGSDILISNGVKIPVSTPANAYNSMMYIPVRDVCNAFDIASENITYDGNSRTVQIIF